MIQAIPARGTMPSTRESSSDMEDKSPPPIPLMCTTHSDGWTADNRHCHPRRPPSRLEGDVHGLAVLGGQGHLLILLAELFMHESQRVVSRWQPL